MKETKKQIIERYENKVAELEKTIEQKESTIKYHSGEADTAKKEIASLHLVMDGIDICPKRTIKDEASWNGKTELTLSARFTGLLAALIHRQFKPSSVTTIVED